MTRGLLNLPGIRLADRVVPVTARNDGYLLASEPRATAEEMVEITEELSPFRREAE